MSDSCIPMIPTEDVLPIATTEVIPVTEITTVPTSDPVEEEETTMAMTTAELTMTSTMTDNIDKVSTSVTLSGNT
uniref:DUF281 domain-containing protein n=1 Tax=Caenorhabditis tropicalis TaxID=1561998 RepID=A0A1I7UT47_9PELO